MSKEHDTSQRGYADSGTVRAYEENYYPWSIERIPRTLKLGGKTVPHPGRTHAIFVVHGIGQQNRTETAATLRSGFEDALEEIEQWQVENLKGRAALSARDFGCVPPPFVSDGYWSNYDEMAETFKDDWKRFNENERLFFGYLWQRRTTALRTYTWFLWQQVRLLSPRVAKEVKFYWLLYLPLQLVSLVALTVGLLRTPKVLTRFLADVRLYLQPRGMVEKAVVQRIDYRVGAAFLKMIGLDWEFRPLPNNRRLKASGETVQFTRVVWVAHSLGTVISYNVLSDLFHRAAQIDRTGDREQKAGVARFRATLRRFVTLGSPLDKVAFLFGTKSLRPWPGLPRSDLLKGGERLRGEDDDPLTEWWINFHHVLDPVSGSLTSQLICGSRPPLNLLSGFSASGLVPGLAHVHYWADAPRTLRYILGRTYGHEYLPDREFRPFNPLQRWFLVAVGYFVWLALLVGGAWAIVKYAPAIWNFTAGWAAGLLKSI